MYKTRHLENKLRKLASVFKVILINGARQVGKSTLVGHVFPGVPHVTFNPVSDDFSAYKDPNLFLDNNIPPLILDEIQYVPDLLALIKMRVDQNPNKGQYILTGSQNFSVLKKVSESLAGRVVILNLNVMSLFEQFDAPDKAWVSAYINDPENFYKRKRSRIADDKSIYDLIWRGSFPGTLQIENNLLEHFYSSYVQTYVERDIKLLVEIRDQMEFTRFLSICSALTAQEINYLHIGRDIGITHTTSRRWLHSLQHSFQWFELMPFIGNTLKRITKKPKGYISDTGLACFLQHISSPIMLQNHPSFGALFETFMINNIRIVLASSVNAGLYHWRTGAGAEVDLIVEKDNLLYPIEIKGKTNIQTNDLRGIKAFFETYDTDPKRKVANAVIVYLGKELIQVDKRIFAVPFNMLLDNANSAPTESI